MSVVTETVEFYANDYHMMVLGSIRPIICTPEPIKKMRRHYYHDIEKVLKWDEETKEKLIDILTDVVSVQSFYHLDFKFWLDEIERKLKELREFEILQRLKGYLEHIDSIQRKRIIKMAVNRIISHIDTILRELILQMPYIDDKSVKESFIIGSMLRLIRNLLEVYLRIEDNHLLMVSTTLTLRFASYVKEKLTLSDIQKDISSCAKYLKSEPISDEVFREVICILS